ncbi:MAG: RNA polymerase sigma factor [Bacteriovoracaceae bacterium]
MTELYRRWKNGLFRFCVRLVSDAEAAEDIVHDAFVTLIEARQTVNKPASLRSWMYTVVRNDSFSFLKKKKQIRLLEEHDEGIFDDGSLMTQVERGEQRRQIATLLECLLPQYKEVLLLREYESMNYEEIAAVTGSTVNAVKSRLFKARKALYTQMEPLRKASEI